MASKAVVASTVLLLSFNLLFFTMVSSTYAPEPSALPPATTTKCPVDALQLGVCADVLGLVNFGIGKPPKMPCCTLIQGLVDLEAAVCLCTAIKANILGINLNIPINLSLVLDYCDKSVPSGYECA